ncbi:MAG: PspA/IM30 family protein [Gemmatimonadota bacterium]
MLDRLKRALDAALTALEARSGHGPEEEIDELLRAMREELIAARARLPELEGVIRKHERAVELETRKAEECARRARQAAAIDDGETAEVALRFEERHRSRAGVLEQKLKAARAEFELQKRTVSEMTEQLKGAIARRDAVAARARRARATGKVRGGRPGVLDEFDRLVERVERAGDVGAASRELDEELGPGSGGGDADVSPVDREELAELQLEELKRRMAAEEGKRGES